jgi:hypothetical protein
MMLAVYLGMLHSAEGVLAESFRTVADGHGDEPDVYHTCVALAQQCEEHARQLHPITQRYGEQPDDEPERLHAVALAATRSGPVGLLRDLQDLYLIASLVDSTYTLVKQAGAALRDRDLLDFVGRCEGETATQLAWLSTRMKQAAPQALVVAA